MNSQANSLRLRMQALQPSKAPAGAPSHASRRALAHTVALASGKGGVGKSTVALSIAWAAAERGVKTALIDADLGLANLDILCGVQPLRTAADWLMGRAVLADCFMRLAPRLWLLPGASGVARMADLQEPQRIRLIEGLARVAEHVQLMVVDLGAGLGAGTLDVAVAADGLLLVCTPEPTSVADAYGFMKACAKRGRTDHIMLAMNMVTDGRTAQRSAARLRSTAQKYLGLQLRCVGGIPMDGEVRSAVSERQPLMARAPGAAASRALRELEGALRWDRASDRASDCAAPEAHSRLLPGSQALVAAAPAAGVSAPAIGFLGRLAKVMGLSPEFGAGHRTSPAQ